MSMITSQILKFVDFTKIQKSRYLENETLFFLGKKKKKKKKFINYTSRATLWQKNTFVTEVTLISMKDTSRDYLITNDKLPVLRVQ